MQTLTAEVRSMGYDFWIAKEWSGLTIVRHIFGIAHALPAFCYTQRTIEIHGDGACEIGQTIFSSTERNILGGRYMRN